ncbi:beta-propeller domain-containing protein [bacterium]|nr:beta-propeller domain-containing protein [bacterium]
MDEPEILKSNGKYLFYYSEPDYNEKYISIIKTPTKNDLSDAEIAAKITIPSSIYNTQLFLNGNKLVIL